MRAKNGIHCTQSDCGSAAVAKGLCSKHYQQWRRTQTFAPSDRWLGPVHSVTLDLPVEQYKRIKRLVEPGGVARWIREAVASKLND